MSQTNIDLLIVQALTAQKDLEEIKEQIHNLPIPRVMKQSINERIDTAERAIQKTDVAIANATYALAESIIQVQALENVLDELADRLCIPHDVGDGIKKRLTRFWQYLEWPMLICIRLIFMALVIGLILALLLRH